jgi:hypothetical protein
MASIARNPVPSLARLASGRAAPLRDLAAGAVLLAAWLFLWSWFALAAFPQRLPGPAPEPPAAATSPA